ncbi:MAG: cellulase family glycosylhydrolase [Verrucomicrobia bacterium]|nr:cellulase family glycosylhydrolase [Verrucomicrobiota bacterium]
MQNNTPRRSSQRGWPEIRIPILPGCALISLIAIFDIAASAEDIHVPDFSVNDGGYHATSKGITLANDRHVKPLDKDSLKITATGASGLVKSPAFAIRPTARTTRAVKGKDLAFWRVKYYLRNNLTRGACRMRLRILDPDDPYEIGFEHFGGADTIVNGFTCTHKPLCAVVSTHPHKRLANGNNNAELILSFDNAQGEVWLSDVEITTATAGGPGFTTEEWNTFETADGIHYVGVAANMFQPEYAPTAPGGYVSKLIMDSAHKLFRVAGFNMVRLFTYWNDRNAHYPATQHQAIIWNSDANGGTGNYEESLNAIRDGVENLAYYGLQTQLCLRGSPDWSHPLHQNNHEKSSRDDPQRFANPGNRNGVGDPYFGPQYVHNRHWLYPPDSWQTWRDFATQLATKLKGKGLIYEIMNEIDMPDQDALIGGYKAYVLWIKHFHEVAKVIDPDAKILVADAGKMLPPLIAEGVLQYADGVAFHLYSGEPSYVRAMVQSSGRKVHLYMSEFMRFRPDLKNIVRQEVLWNAFSTLAYRDFAKILTLVDADGNQVNRDKPAGWGDRVRPTQQFDEWGANNGVFLPKDREGNGGDRIKAEVICNLQMTYGSTQTVTLRAVNTSSTTFHDVRLWPVGFVDNLGFDMKTIRDADARIGTFSPGQTYEIKLTVCPRTTRFKAAGVYDLGLAIVTREGKHSLALKSVTVISNP